MTLILILTLVAQTPWPPYLRPDADIEHRTVLVEYVYDGDTFRGEDGTEYRLAGIDAPEVAHPEHGKPFGEPGGKEASDALKQLIQGQQVTVLIDKANSSDRYSRTVGVVMLGNLDVNLSQVRDRHAEIRYVDLSPMIDENAFRQNCQLPSGESQFNSPTHSDSVGILNLEFGISARRNLAAGDRVRIVVGPQTEDFTINPDGEILIRGLGVVRIGGMTPASATASLDSAIRAKGITATPITVFYLAPPTKIQRNVVMLGAIRKSGTYPATTLLTAISAAEGFTFEANPTEVRITQGETTTIVNAAMIMRGVERDIELLGGEVIIVPALPRILVSGAVAKPNWVTAQFLSEAVSAAGGLLPEAELDHVEIRADSTETPIRINLQDIFSGKAEDIRLDDRARITIPVRPRAVIPTVQIYGPVERPGTTQSHTVADAIRESRPDTTADLAHVIIDRGNGESTTVDARDIILGHAVDPDLKPGDRILIPRRPELTVTAPPDTPALVTVIGDVAKPGQYPPGTITQLLASAGGPTNTSRLSAIHVTYLPGADSTSHAAASTLSAQTYDLSKITTGRQPDPFLPPGSTLYLESDEPRREGMNDLRTFIGIFSTLILLGLRFGAI